MRPKLHAGMKHGDLCGSTYFHQESCEEHIVGFDPEGSTYFILNVESGEVSFSDDDMRTVIKELKKNYE